MGKEQLVISDEAQRVLQEKLHSQRLILDASSFLKQRGKTELAKALEEVYEQAVPFLEKARHGNPIHHTAVVASTLVKIMLEEPVFTDLDRKRLIATAVFHDCGFANLPSDQKKITKRMIEAAESSEREGMRQKGIYLRLQHAVEGARIAQDVLKTVQGFSTEDIGAISELIRNHDNPSVAELEDNFAEKKKWLFKSEEVSAMTLREADRLWMLSPEGILIDLERDRAAGKTTSREEMISHNLKRHWEERELYEKVFSFGEIESFGFAENSAFYRTKVGRQLFQAHSG